MNKFNVRLVLKCTTCGELIRTPHIVKLNEELKSDQLSCIGGLMPEEGTLVHPHKIIDKAIYEFHPLEFAYLEEVIIDGH